MADMAAAEAHDLGRADQLLHRDRRVDGGVQHRVHRVVGVREAAQFADPADPPVVPAHDEELGRLDDPRHAGDQRADALPQRAVPDADHRDLLEVRLGGGGQRGCYQRVEDRGGDRFVGVEPLGPVREQPFHRRIRGSAFERRVVEFEPVAPQGAEGFAHRVPPVPFCRAFTRRAACAAPREKA